MSALYGSLLLLNLALAPPQRRELLAEAAARRICFAIGPIRDRARALEISERYGARQVRTELKTSLDKRYLGVMVYVGGHESRADAASTGERLAAHGIRDQLILSPEDRPHLLSQGRGAAVPGGGTNRRKPRHLLAPAPQQRGVQVRAPGCGARHPGESGIASIFPGPRSARPPVQPRRRFI